MVFVTDHILITDNQIYEENLLIDFRKREVIQIKMSIWVKKTCGVYPA